MTEPITMTKLELEGFRAYLKPKTFNLHSRKNGPLSMAVFAPNGKGKSSMVDSLEYYFHKGGSLERLGQKSTATRAGVSAIRHVDAERFRVETYVRVQFRQGRETFGDSRPFRAPLTDQAKRVLKHAKVPFVIRGYELRQFIDEKSPTDRYGDLVTWLDLSPLLAVQKNMKELKRQVKKEAADTREADLRLRDLADVTGNAIRTWDEHSVLEWLNARILASLDASIKFGTLSDADPAFRKLESQKQAEMKRAGLETLEKLLHTIDGILGRHATSPENPAGKISSFERSVLTLRDATADESAARSATSESVFREVWESAKSLLGSDSKFDKCPVCGMEFAKSPSGSRDGAHANLSLNLDNLKEYRKAEAAKERAKADLVQAARDLVESLDRLQLLAGSEYEYDAVTAYHEALQSWSVGEEPPDSKGAVQALASLHVSVSADIERIGRQQGGLTYSNTLEKVRRLLYVKAEFGRIMRTKNELRIIMSSLDRQVEAFNKTIVEHIRGLVGRLVDEADMLYRGIQGSGAKAPRIQIKLAGEGDAEQRSAKLLIDFADREGVAPGGYLSDSQVHTLALSVRLAAIRLFNAGVRIIVLDDIVTSYDADHRKNIAAVLNDKFAEFQIILATHDEQFFNMLREHLGDTRWEYKQIEELRPGVGPIFDDHRIRDDEIEAKIKAGKDAAHDIRRVEEKWLSDTCYDFETSTKFRRNWDPGVSYMAMSLDKFLKDSGLGSPIISGHSKPFLQSMQRANIENMGSHHRNGPYASSSVGDTLARWEEFKRFRSMFTCRCGHSRFKRPDGLKIPICRKCEAQFSFELQTSPAS